MQVIRSQQMATNSGDETHFTGTVWVMEMVKVPPPNGVNVYSVCFESRARTAWHSHPDGQILYVTAGKGRVIRADGSDALAFEIGPGDIVYIAPNEKHWHGAAPDNVFSHIAITLHLRDESTK